MTVGLTHLNAGFKSVKVYFLSLTLKVWMIASHKLKGYVHNPLFFKLLKWYNCTFLNLTDRICIIVAQYNWKKKNFKFWLKIFDSKWAVIFHILTENQRFLDPSPAKYPSATTFEFKQTDMGSLLPMDHCVGHFLKTAHFRKIDKIYAKKVT